VVDGGNYDGPLGVITGILAVAHFCGKPPLPIDVLAFGDEEGSRFPSTLSSSAACVGAFEPETLELADRNGVSFADALKAYRKNPADIPKAAYRRGEALGYVEVHIEQGPRLEAENQPLGVVTGIVGQSRWRVIVTGEAGHAGKTAWSRPWGRCDPQDHGRTIRERGPRDCGCSQTQCDIRTFSRPVGDGLRR
jgi:allantoate deiminase